MHPFHAFCSLDVLKGEVVLAPETVHDIPLEVLQEIDFALQFVGVELDRMRLPNVDRTMLSGSDVIKVPSKEYAISSSSEASQDANSPFISTQHKSCAIVEVHTDTTIRQSVGHPVLVAVI